MLIIHPIIDPMPPSIIGGASMRRSGGTLSGLLPHFRARHAPAFLGAAAAGFRALLAMRHRVLGAFLPAFLADGRAQLADVGSQLAAPRHVAHGHPADRGAVAAIRGSRRV